MRQLQSRPTGIAQLEKKNGEPTCNDKEAAERLGEFFQEVYTLEKEMPQIDDDTKFEGACIDLGEATVMKALQ